jgi:hypothetical protein
LPETRFIFWNLNRKPLAEVAAEISIEQSADIVVLAESGDPVSLLLAFNRNISSSDRGFHFASGQCRALTILTRFSAELIRPVWESERISIRRLELPARADVLICAVHLPSKLHWSDSSQAFESIELARQIMAEEDRVGHRRSVLLGDFNMNPFEPGMISANGLHAVMSRQVASRIARTVQGREHRFFYNPMWGHLGDLRGATAGSYFREAAEHVNYFWNVFDQVPCDPNWRSSSIRQASGF